MRDNELTGNAETHNASSGLVKDDSSRGGTLRTRDCVEQGCPARKWTNRMNDRPIEEPNQRRSLGQKGDWETTPFGGHSRYRNQEVHNCGHNRGENGRRM